MSQIKFFDKNIIDLDNPDVTITVNDSVASNNGQSFVDFVRNRKLTSGWATTGSTDAALTYLEIEMLDSRIIQDIIIIGHTFKDFTLHAWNGLGYDLIDTQTSVTDTTTYISLSSAIITSRIKLTISACQIVDGDKFLKQLIFTNEIGQFEAYPQIKRPEHDTNKKISTMLSGKAWVAETSGSFSLTLDVKNWHQTNDLELIENLYENKIGFLVWLCGGDEDQFLSKRKGYKKEDLYLMRPIDDYSPEYWKTLYKNGLNLKIKLREIIR